MADAIHKQTWHFAVFSISMLAYGTVCQIEPQEKEKPRW